MHFISLFLAVLSISITVGQNCGIYNADSTGGHNFTVTTITLNETSPGNQFFWSGLTYNISSYTEGPMSKYLNTQWSGQSYVLRTVHDFGQLVQMDKDLSFTQHFINLTCTDDEVVEGRFFIPFRWIIDPINRHPPNFNSRSYLAIISRSEMVWNSAPFNIGINVTDNDPKLENANVVIKSSNAGVNLLVSLVTDQPFTYEVKFLVDFDTLTDSLHEVTLTADDGVYSNSVFLDLVISP